MSSVRWDNRASVLIEALKGQLGALSDEELAADLGMGKSTISSWRRRGTLPSRVERDIADRYGLTFDEAVLRLNSDHGSRETLLKAAFYYALIELSRDAPALDAEGALKLSQELAAAEKEIKAAIAGLASKPSYKGIVGAAMFLADVATGKVDIKDAAKRALAGGPSSSPSASPPA